MEASGGLWEEVNRCCQCPRGAEDRSEKGSGDGGSFVAVADEGSEAGDDSDWSESRQGVQEGRKGVVNDLRLEGNQEIMVSDCNPTSLGFVSGNVLLKVNGTVVEKENVLLDESRALAIVPVGAEGMLEDGSNLGVLVRNVADSTCSSRALEEDTGLQVGPTNALREEVLIGPNFVQPKFLRTKQGDLSLEEVERGVRSKVADLGELGQGVSCGQGPLTLPNTNPTQLTTGNPSVQGTSLLTHARGKGGRIKKTMKKPLPFHPYLAGSTHHKLFEFSKGGLKNKKKVGGRDKHLLRQSNSTDTDSIDCSEADAGDVRCAQARVEDQDCEAEGIELEVVLPFFDANEDLAGESGGPNSVVAGGGIGNSGLCGLLGNNLLESTSVSTAGVMVDKDRGDAQHVIDIQEELGVKFLGDINDEVVRCMRMEQRDRLLKNDWVHGNGYQ
jgi:hypothetical protein